jgi:glutamyl-tRNA synthetase
MLNGVPRVSAGALKAVLASQGMKMPQLAIPVRVKVCGRSQTPALDQVLALFDKNFVLDRLRKRLNSVL